MHTLKNKLLACRLHLLTKHRVFSGPGFQLAVELSDAAYGGQVRFAMSCTVECCVLTIVTRWRWSSRMPPMAARCAVS